MTELELSWLGEAANSIFYSKIHVLGIQPVNLRFYIKNLIINHYDSFQVNQYSTSFFFALYQRNIMKTYLLYNVQLVSFPADSTPNNPLPFRFGFSFWEDGTIP
jgi:hypothetical protein